MISFNDYKFKEIISSDEIKRAVHSMANHIDGHYPVPEDIVFIGILNGAFIFLADLVRAVHRHSEITFTHLKSYYGMDRSDKVEVVKDIDLDIENKHVILVEDIIDSGNTIYQYHQLLKTKNPKSIAIYALLMKPENIQYELPTFQVGFEVPNKFVIGYGLDYNGMGRNLEGIYQLIEE